MTRKGSEVRVLYGPLGHEAETELHQAFLSPELRDRIDNALAELIRAERASVFDQLVICIKRPENRFPDSWASSPLS